VQNSTRAGAAHRRGLGFGSGGSGRGRASCTTRAYSIQPFLPLLLSGGILGLCRRRPGPHSCPDWSKDFDERVSPLVTSIRHMAAPHWLSFLSEFAVITRNQRGRRSIFPCCLTRLISCAYGAGRPRRGRTRSTSSMCFKRPRVDGRVHDVRFYARWRPSRFRSRTRSVQKGRFGLLLNS